MKTIITIILITLLFSLSIYSQNRQAMLDSIAYSVSPYGAIHYAIENNIVESLPLIEQAFWRTKEISSKSECLNAMLFFHSPNLHLYARAVYDSAQYYAYHESEFLNSDDGSTYVQMTDSLHVKVMATYFLIMSGDYSTVQCIFDLLRRDKGKSYINTYAQRSLKEIIRHVPLYADSAKTELRQIIKEGSSSLDRWSALYDFVEVYGKDAFPEILYVEMNDKDPRGGNNSTAFNYLFELEYPDLYDFLRQRLSTELWPSARSTIADSLLSRYGTPQDYEFVRQYISYEPDQVARRSIENALKNFKPPKPSITMPVMTMLDTLFLNSQQCVFLNWLGDHNFTIELNGYMATAKNNLDAGNQMDCARQIRTFQQRINEEYIDTLDNDEQFVTIEGWKFLYYNAQYILDRLPQIPAESAVDMLDTLSTRLQMSYSSNWIGNQIFIQILEKNIQNAKSKYAAKDSIGCAQEIENFYKLVRLKYISPGMQFVKIEAYNLLYNYAREITGKVIVLPPKSNATLIDQITALKAQIRTDASVKLLGGELLLRGLESSLEIAKQKLQKSDSISSALYITLFQQTARQTYEITKKYPAIRIYVKAGGYISLYYRAEYILEHLTVPIGQPMPKMSKELEEELGKYLEVSR